MYWGAPTVGEGGGRQTAVVPADVLTYRRVPLPPASRSVCRRVVQEELAYSLPFPLEQSSWDFAGRAGGQALVVVAPQERLSGIQRLAGVNTTLDAEPLAYLRAATFCGVHNALIIDLGATKTTLCAVVEQQIEWVRVMMRGGRQITSHLAQENGITQEQAEDLKRRKGCELGVCQNFVAELLEEAMINKTTPFEQVLLCGGGAAMLGLKSFLSLRLGIEPQTFPLPPPLSAYQHVSAFGAALAERPGQPRVRLMVGSSENAKVGGVDPWIFLGVVWAIAILLGIFDIETRIGTLRKRQVQAKNELVQVLSPWVPGIEKERDKLTAAAMVDRLKSSIEARKAQRQQSVRYISDTFARMATALRENPKAEIRNFSYEEGKVVISGEVSSLQQAEAFRERLSKIFPDLQQTSTRAGVPGRYNYQFEGKMPSP
jgi:hypothetical protein